MTRPLIQTAFVPIRKKAVAVQIVKKPKTAAVHPFNKPKALRSRRESGTLRVKPDIRVRRARKRRHPRRHRSNTTFRPAANKKKSATYAEGFGMGYQAGSTDGAERELVALLPPYTVLPEVSAKEVMAAGLWSYLSRLKPLLRPEDVYRRMADSVAAGKPLSIVRLGDGELLALAHDTVLPLEHARAAGNFLPIAGMQLPDYAARGLLAEAVRKADIIGIPSSRLPTFQGLLFPVLSYYGIDYGPLDFTVSTINYALHEHGFLEALLRDKRVLVIGNRAGELARVLAGAQVHVAGVISPVNGFADIPRVLAEASACSFDIALVASGIPAVVICQSIAERLGKVALDFGHLADKLVSGEMSYH